GSVRGAGAPHGTDSGRRKEAKGRFALTAERRSYAMNMNQRAAVALSPYAFYLREEWARLRADTPMPLTEAELENLSGLTEKVSTKEVVEIYLPLSRLLNFYVEAAQRLHKATEGFLRKGNGKMPFVIGLAGSVAAGKSTTAR